MITVNSFADRLKFRSAKNSFTNNISRNFNLTRIFAEAHFDQIKDYFTEHVRINLTSGHKKNLFTEYAGLQMYISGLVLKPAVSFQTHLQLSCLNSANRSHNYSQNH
jgi:hypothetical protein